MYSSEHGERRQRSPCPNSLRRRTKLNGPLTQLHTALAGARPSLSFCFFFYFIEEMHNYRQRRCPFRLIRVQKMEESRLL